MFGHYHLGDLLVMAGLVVLILIPRHYDPAIRLKEHNERRKLGARRD